MNVNLRISDSIGPHLDRIARELGNPRKVVAVATKELEIGLRKHFLSLDGKGNKRGWPTRHFWSRKVEQKTAISEISAKRGVVTVDSPEYAHKLAGGIISPKRGRALAMPATAQAYAKGSPRELDRDFLEFIPIKAGGNLVGFLRERRHSDVETRTERGGTVWYWLLKRVSHKPDRAAQPPMQALSGAILQRVGAMLDRVLKARR
jgi:hypothetical protein